ncbi:hypothetical protein ACI8AC_00060 [Geodermatophilus sp. SYSU D00758]
MLLRIVSGAVAVLAAVAAALAAIGFAVGRQPSVPAAAGSAVVALLLLALGIRVLVRRPSQRPARRWRSGGDSRGLVDLLADLPDLFR